MDLGTCREDLEHTACQEALSRCQVKTPLGPVGLVWSPRGVKGVVLPGGSLKKRLNERWPEARDDPAPPAWVEDLSTRLSSHLGGDPDGFEDVPLDLEGVTPFHREAMQAARAVGPGEVTTYGDLARSLGRPNSARAVGGAMSRNPIPLLVPCHRVVGSDGSLRGFAAPEGIALKRKILQAEGAQV